MTWSIEVVYATPDHQDVVEISAQPPLTIKQAVDASGLLEKYPEIELSDDLVGVFGYRQNLSYSLSDGDRVEIYRPLTMSPTEARRLRAASKNAKTGSIAK